MDTPTYNTAKQHLLAAAMAIAPTGVEQRAFSKLVGEAERDYVGENDPYRHVILHLTSAIHDGLAYGNWPKA